MEPPWYDKLKEERFWAYDNDDGGRRKIENYYLVDAVLVYKGRYCEFWVDKNREISRETIKTMADEFDTKIYPQNSNYFGDFRQGIEVLVPDEDWSDLPVYFLLLDIKDSYGKNGSVSYTAGYFDSNDLFPSSGFEDYSNAAPLLYIDTAQQDPMSLEALSTIAHEFQHLINFCQSLRFRIVSTSAEKTLYTMDVWIDEGLASAAEQIYLGNTPYTSRIKHYNDDPYKTIAKGNNFFVWGEKDSIPGSRLDDYATVYLFFQWLNIQYNGTSAPGKSIYRQIISSKNWDYRAVTGAANINSPSWEYLLKNWLIANTNPSASTAYDGKFSLTIHPVSSGSLSLYPGEGVYCNTISKGLSGHIQSVDAGISLKAVYNANTNNEGGGLSVTVSSSIANAEQDETSVMRSVSSEEPYALDVWDIRGYRNRQSIPLNPDMGAEVKLRRSAAIDE
jgi:hypothetical protein